MEAEQSKAKETTPIEGCIRGMLMVSRCNVTTTEPPALGSPLIVGFCPISDCCQHGRMVGGDDGYADNIAAFVSNLVSFQTT
jgi:hypothetical protein